MLNVHPIIVHFPVAFLTVYALLECVRFKRILQLPYIFYVKAVIVITGTLGSYAAFLSGNNIKSLYRGDAQMFALVNRHSQFAVATIWFFSFLALAYALDWCGRAQLPVRLNGRSRILLEKAIRIAHAMVESPFIVIIAIVGLMLVTITGGLGGTIVYGPDIDPVASVIYKIFGPK